MRNIVLIFALFILVVFLSGCGETMNGMVKDTKRIGSGVKKVFIRE
ncbi:MAG: hypothetical protein U9R44_01815 [Candidatus Omnitrophota bacterium]|nr:hypothetical protein [Candidatus Omnitrophota bacterium]